MEYETTSVGGVKFQRTGDHPESSYECIDDNGNRSGISLFWYRFDGRLKPATWGINWAGCGTKNVLETRIFSSQLGAAALLARKLNNYL